MNLYDKHAKDFSNTRQHPWKGWELALKNFKPSDNFNVLDIGCGNARFYSFLKERFSELDYLGIDYSEEMLKEASKVIDSSNLIQLDLEKESLKERVDQKFDLIVMFGVMHHIKSRDRRKKILREIHSLLNKNGVAIITFWQFSENKEFLKKHLIEDLGKNDFIISFGKEGATRFAHSFTKEEVDSLYKELYINVKDSFNSDGFNDEMNYYVISNIISS